MENKNGQGIFYGVIGVATLVVAIIGATFAYFSAQAQTNYVNDITGGTNDDLAAALSVVVEKVTFTGTTAASNSLVPTNLDGTTTGGINAALTKKCEDAGYTGCHLYRITAKSTQTIAAASVNLATLTTGTSAKVETDWKYSIFTGSESSATALVGTGGVSFPVSTAVDMHGGASMTANQNYVYYLLIYLQDDNGVQNDGGTNDATGTYNGTVTMTAANGGHVTASFSA